MCRRRPLIDRISTVGQSLTFCCLSNVGFLPDLAIVPSTLDALTCRALTRPILSLGNYAYGSLSLL